MYFAVLVVEEEVVAVLDPAERVVNSSRCRNYIGN
jgi:hypothetical protein